jgi:hypothetical protein
MNRFFKICILSFVLLAAGCEKQPLDYRNKFIGDYQFSVYYSYWTLPNISDDTSYTADGRVWYGSDPHTVLITIADALSFEYTVYEDGTLEASSSGDPWNNYGEFESTRKIKFTYTSGGLGGRSQFEISGEKK